jgi:2-keto-4-pentenoate hydratase
MVKATKFLRKQADKAERTAHAVQDAEAARQMLNLADAYRAQADVLNQKSKKPKKIKAAN